MGKQLSIFDHKYSFNMTEQKVGMLYAEIEKLKKENEKLKFSNRAYKGHFTKQSKKQHTC